MAQKSGAADTTPELTGDDATACEATPGDAGNGASPWGADLAGCPRTQEAAEGIETADAIEEDPGSPEDIEVDKLTRGASAPDLDDEEDDLTAKPMEENRIRPMTPDLLPSDDPDAAHG
jgi:hypothetical protein